MQTELEAALNARLEAENALAEARQHLGQFDQELRDQAPGELKWKARVGAGYSGTPVAGGRLAKSAHRVAPSA